jgi:nicotinamide phosphoribosyltransferase
VNFKTNIFPPHATDFYKTGHARQYVKGVTKLYANFTPRSGHRAPAGTVDRNHVVWFGGQMAASKYLVDAWNQNFFWERRSLVLDKIERRMDSALGVGMVELRRWEDLHKLGFLPLHVKQLPEGALVPYRVPTMTFANTHDEFAWTTLYGESLVSSAIWKPMTTATTAYNARLILNHYVMMTGGSLDAARFQLHDFSFRGQSTPEDGENSCVGHLLSSAGTDTILAIDGAEQFYGADATKELVGAGVPATEHSVMCLGIASLGSEEEVFRSLLKEYPSGIVSVVSDTLDYWFLLRELLPRLKSDILARTADSYGFKKTVIRPDSGDPYRIIVGWLPEEIIAYEGDEALVVDASYTGGVRRVKRWEADGSLVVLANLFGTTLNQSGYRDLDEHIGLIYGDSINLENMNRILNGMMRKRFSANNCVFGLGSFTYQYVTRDTHGSALKATWAVVDGQELELSKDPATDSGVKKSARGLLRVDRDEDGEYYLKEQCSVEEEMGGELQTLFYNGSLDARNTLSDMRVRLGVF